MMNERPKLASKVAILVIMSVVMLVALTLAIWQPWQHRRAVLSASVPNSPYTVELWEKPYWCFGGYEYETWFVVRSPLEGARWHTIDAQYITFTDVTVFISSDLKTVRVEVGKGADSHMIAEYNLQHKTFRAASEASVRGKEGWDVLSAARIH